MRRRLVASIVLLTAIGAPLAAQSVSKDGEGSSVGVAANGQVFRQMSGYVLASAKEMSEADFAFRPTDKVRTFGQLVGHLAGANYMFCAAALGEQPRAEDDIEKTRTTKAALVEAMQASITYCNRAYAITDAQASAPLTMFGQQTNRMWALALNAAHNGEHYGNIVTYMRIKGMVPPSSR